MCIPVSCDNNFISPEPLSNFPTWSILFMKKFVLMDVYLKKNLKHVFIVGDFRIFNNTQLKCMRWTIWWYCGEQESIQFQMNYYLVKRNQKFAYRTKATIQYSWLGQTLTVLLSTILRVEANGLISHKKYLTLFDRYTILSCITECIFILTTITTLTCQHFNDDVFRVERYLHQYTV